MAYSDVVDPVAMLNRAPEGHTGPQVADAIANAGFEVQAVNWVWQKIVGESLVDSIIKPITGDFDKIAEQAGQWKNVSAALQAVRNNLNVGLGELQGGWTGEAADKFRNLIGQTWTLGIEADAQAANLIGFALNKVAQGSRRACDQILHLIKMLVDKLIEAAAMLPIPVVGWGRAVKLVYDGIQIYNAIMQLIEGIRAIIQGAQQVIDGIQQVGTALSKIKDIHNLNDALNVANEAGQGIVTTAQGARQVQYGATQAAGAAGDLARSTASAHDNATGLRDERAAAAAPSGVTTGPGSTTRGTPGQTGSTNRPGDPNATRTPEGARTTSGDPVDVTTGEVILGQTDVDLPGVLPLLLRRTHISSYRAGRGFGRSWASTVDQRLELDADGVVFVADDGMLLVYPDPGSGEAVPQVGPRWPLRRTENGYTISKPESRQELHFAGTPGAVRPLVGIADQNGNRISLLHDTSGVITEVVHSGGYHLDVATDRGQVTELRLRTADGPAIPLVRYAYSAAGDLTEVINSSNLPLRFGYDGDGRLTQWTDRNGRWYRYFYDERGRCIANQGADGLLNGTFSYEGRTTRYTDALGHTTAYRYDERGNVVAETDPLGHTTTSEYDARDRLTARTDPLGRTTRFEYDDAGRLVRLTRADGAPTALEYGEAGLVTSVVEPGDLRSEREYDERGNVVTVTDAAGAVTRFGYDDHGALAEVVDAAGGVRRVETDAAGLVVSATDGLGATTRYQRDVFGRISAVIDPVGGVTRYSWSIEGKLLSRTLPDGATERWTYDGEGNLIEYRDALSQTSRTEFGGLDLATARTGPDGTRLEFGYDANLRLTSVTNPQGLTWRYGYDAAGNLISETDFNGRTLTYEHDAAGQLVVRTNGAGETTTFVRDALGNVVEKRTGDTVTTTFGFDAAGRLIRAATPDVAIEYERDPVGRVLAETVNGRTLRSAFDALGRRTQRRTPSGAESTWSFDANSNPTHLTTAGHTVHFGYDAAGREVLRQLDEGAVLAQAWDVNHRLVGQQVTGRDARLVQERRYHYRPDGQMAGVDDRLAGSRRFDLDLAGRVTAVHGQGWTERYAYDAVGNITQAGWPAAPDDAASTDSQGAREYAGTLIRRAGRTQYQHDRQGRLVMRRQHSLSGQVRTWIYGWDAEDRLVRLTTPDGTEWRYVYDAFGRRVAKRRLGGDGQVAEETIFTWDGLSLAEQTTGDATTTWEVAPGSIRPVAQIERTSPQELVDQRFYAIVTDLVGTPVEMLDPSGDVAWRLQTTLWGRAYARGGIGPECPLRFPGQYHDAETGDAYNYQRYYDPSAGRYESTDPLGLIGSANPHTYVPNPNTWADPLGLTPCTPNPTRTGASSFAVDPHGNVTDLRPGHRPDHELVFSGHGTIPTGDTSTVTVPPGTHLNFYSPHGTTISDSLGNRIERYGTATPHETFGPGARVPDYILSPPGSLNIMGTPVTVTQPTRLSELLRPNQGNVHWAACREVYP
jgi:RHS repeat-associated protein